MRSWPGIVASAAVLLTSGCGKSDLEKFADAYCGEVAKCCKQLELGNGGMCRALYDIPGAESAYNKSAGQACLAEMRALVAAGTFCDPPSNPSSPCESVFESDSGKRRPGETCDFDSDCAPASDGEVACASAYDGDERISKCQVRLRGKVGDACVGTRDGDTLWTAGSGVDDVEPRAYVCDTADGVECSTGTCVALAAVGQTCSFSDECVRDAFCDDTRQECTARLASSAPCTGADAMECVAGHYCPASSPRQCVPTLPFGSPCGADPECTSLSCESGACGLSFAQTFGWAMMCADPD